MKKILFLFILLLTMQPFFAQDTDSDGIANVLDLDDDNDGILDADENTCIASSKIEGTPIFINDFGTGPTTSDPYVLNHTYTTGNANDGFYNVRTSAATVAFHNRTNVTGDKDAGNPTITNGTTTGRYLMINIDSPNNTNKAIYRVTGINTQVGQSYRFRIDMAGLAEGRPHIPNLKIAIKDASNNELASATSTSIGMANDDVWRRLNLEFTATTSSVILEIINEQPSGNAGNDVGIDNIILTPLYCDLDNDGTPNQFDLDSDNDGCPDAIEGDENVTAAHLNPSGSIIVGANGSGSLEVNANGVPKLVNGTTHNATGGGSTAAGVADIGNDQGQGIGEAYTVNPAAVGGTASSNQTIVSGATPAALSLSGHTGTIQWQSSTDNVTFNNISGATSTTYAPGALTATTYYRAVLTSAGGCTANSTTVTINIDSDGDGVPDSLDLDDDNDGILDCAENGLDKPIGQIFELNGSATQISSNEVQLTPAINFKAGQMWSYGKVDFTKNFSMPFEAYLGNKNDDGADGIAIVFHNDPDGIYANGGTGGGIGARGIQNGVVLELDTYSNTEAPPLDPAADHGQIWKSSDQTAITSTVALPNLEDGAWHAVVVNWDSASQTLSYTVDGTLAGTYTGNIVTNYFGGANKVYFGFTASTGGLNNDQRVRFSSLCSLPLEVDTDGDGTPNYLDLDSDGDGCPDAIEGDENVTAAHLNPSGSIIVGANGSGSLEVNANGVPKLVNGTTHNATGGGSTAAGVADIGNDQGQGIGDSQNIMVNSCAVPFICDSNMYMVQDPQSKLYRIDTSTNPFNFVQIGTGATYPVNATGYNPTDNFIYGISGGANVAKSLIRIDANGTFYNLGVISGLDIAAGYTSGEMDELGNYYIKLAGQNNKLYKVDVATRTATLIQLSRNINFIDIAYTQTDGLLWTQDTVSKKLVSINPTNGLVTDLPFVNTLNNYGAWFGSGTGQIYASSNDGTAFVEFNKTTGEAMFISTTQPSTNNDGAHCPTAPIKFDLYCSKLPVTNAGTQLPSNHGITALGRAGADNSNWPMVRQSAWTVLEAKTKGFVVNRVANPATDIANPVEGMMVFDTTAQCLKIYNGTVWSCYSTPACP